MFGVLQRESGYLVFKASGLRGVTLRPKTLFQALPLLIATCSPPRRSGGPAATCGNLRVGRVLGLGFRVSGLGFRV